MVQHHKSSDVVPGGGPGSGCAFVPKRIDVIHGPSWQRLKVSRQSQAMTAETVREAEVLSWSEQGAARPWPRLRSSAAGVEVEQTVEI